MECSDVFCSRMEFAFAKLTISDISVFLLNVVLTSIFCLCRETSPYKACVVLILATTDWLSVSLEALFAALSDPLAKTVATWGLFETICPRMFLQTGAFALNMAAAVVNIDLSSSVPPRKRPRYFHLVIFNAISFIVAVGSIEAIAQGPWLKNHFTLKHLFRIAFLVTVYRTIFLTVDSFYYIYVRLSSKDSEEEGKILHI